MTCNVKKHHRKRHPMSEGERVMREICLKMIEQKRFRGFTEYARVLAFRFARKRRERDALRDAGQNPYKRGGKK